MMIKPGRPRRGSTCEVCPSLGCEEHVRSKLRDVTQLRHRKGNYVLWKAEGIVGGRKPSQQHASVSLHGRCTSSPFLSINPTRLPSHDHFVQLVHSIILLIYLLGHDLRLLGPRPKQKAPVEALCSARALGLDYEMPTQSRMSRNDKLTPD